MRKRMSTTLEEYLQAGGWSSRHFLNHAIELIAALSVNPSVKVKIGRHVVHILVSDKVLMKAYVHYNGRSREYLTFTDHRGRELETFHHTVKTDTIASWLNKQLCSTSASR